MSGILTTLEEYLEGSKWRKTLFFLLVILWAIALRLILIGLPNHNYTARLLLWCDQFHKVGRIDAFNEMFFDYSPGLLYLIDVTILFRSILGLIAVKLIPIAFGFILAWSVMQIVRVKYPKGLKPLVAFSLFLPTVFVISSMWNQFYMIYSSLNFNVAFFTPLVPFLLLKMHDRFFLMACVFLLILLFFEPRTAGRALLSQLSSTIANIVFLPDLPEVLQTLQQSSQCCWGQGGCGISGSTW